MNILIISTNRAAHPVPVLPYGACMVADAAERAGHEVRLLDLMFVREPVSAVRALLRSTDFDAIGFSVRNIDNIDMREPRCYIDDLGPLIDAVRGATDAPLVLGGAALMVMPEEILRATRVPLAVLGDGELVFPRLLSALNRGESGDGVPGVASLRDGLFRPALPVYGPAGGPCEAPEYRRRIDVASYRGSLASVPLRTKQGCGFKCCYCTYRKIEGEAYRLRDPESAADAVLRFASQGLCDVEFTDNVFNAPRDHAAAVCEALIRARPRARFQSLELNPAFLDHELLRLMERAGFSGIGMAVESASDRVLHGLRKGFTARDVHRAAELVRAHRLPCLWIFMLGGPGETQDTVRETLRFAARALRPQDAAFFNIGVRVYPGTELETLARSQGALSAPPDRMLEPVYYLSPLVNAAWLAAEVTRAMSRSLNFMDSRSLSFSSLPRITRVARRLGVSPPLWRHTGRIRRGLRLLGMDV